MTDAWSSDKAWFAQNPQANFRIRRERPGEVAEVTRRAVPEAGPELDACGGVFHSPAPEFEWRVMIIRFGRRSFGRVLTLQRVDEPEDCEIQFGTIAMIIGRKMVMDKVGGLL